MAVAIPLPTAAAGVGDLSGSWTYTATCPGPETVNGDVYFECARSGVCEGVQTSDSAPTSPSNSTAKPY
jgi:hypothetical protein